MPKCILAFLYLCVYTWVVFRSVVEHGWWDTLLLAASACLVMMLTTWIIRYFEQKKVERMIELSKYRFGTVVLATGGLWLLTGYLLTYNFTWLPVVALLTTGVMSLVAFVIYFDDLAITNA